MYTVVSAVPYAIRETKPGQIPNEYFIPAADKDIQVVHVTEATYGIYLDETRGALQQTIPSKEVARGLIEDFITAQLEYIPGSAAPALFAVEGHKSVEEIKKFYSKELATAKALQTAWFYRLIRKADDDFKIWGQHRVVSDPQRAAAGALGLKKDWAYTAEEMQQCKACAATIRPGIVICPHCHCILDEERAAKLKFAKVG